MFAGYVYSFLVLSFIFTAALALAREGWTEVTTGFQVELLLRFHLVENILINT